MSRLTGLIALLQTLSVIWSASAEVPDLPLPNEYYQFTPPLAATQKFSNRSDIPFGTYWSGGRYQQVFSASLFTNLPAGGAFLFEVWVRPGCGGMNSTFLTNLVVRISTTQRPVNALSPIFDNNLGEDVMDVREKAVTGVPGAYPAVLCLGGGGDTEPFLAFEFAAPYFYDPAKGNLLMELIIPPHSPYFPPEHGFFYSEVSQRIADGMASIGASGTNAALAESEQPFGLVARLDFAPFPTVSITPTESSLWLSWGGRVVPFGLQSRESLDPAVPWVFVDSSQIVNRQVLAWLELPRSSLTTARYYRVYWDSPQKGLPATRMQ